MATENTVQPTLFVADMDDLTPGTRPSIPGPRDKPDRVEVVVPNGDAILVFEGPVPGGQGATKIKAPSRYRLLL